MKILMAVTYYTPHVSGLTIYVARIAAELARRGHQVTVVTSCHLPGLPTRERIDGVSVIRLPVLFRISKGVIMPTILWDGYSLVRGHDVVHMHLPLMEAPYFAWVAKRSPARKAIITYHCDLRLPHSLLASAIVKALTFSHWLAAKQADCLVTYTRDYAKHSPFLSQFSHKVATVYPPIEVAAPDPSATERWRAELGLDGCRVVGFAGRFSEEKGGNHLLRSIPQVVSAVPNTRYLFAGEYQKVIGEDFHNKMRPLIERHRDRVLFLGELHGQRLSNFYSMCDVLTLPSVNSTESFGMVQVEAMRCGTPVVASDIPGVREPTRVTGMGLVVPPGDESALASGLTEVLLNKERYSTSRIDLATTFSVSQTVDFYEKLYA